MSRIPPETPAEAKAVTRALQEIDTNDRAFTNSTLSYEAYEKTRRLILRLVFSRGALSVTKSLWKG
jgi:hypothetical protein